MPNPPDHEPIAYLNGEFIPFREARLPVWDLGIVQAVTVTEAIRTFRHEPFRVAEHLSRLEFSLSSIGVTPRESLPQIEHLVREVTRYNAAGVSENEDLCVILFVTAGESAVHSAGFAKDPGRPTVCISTRPLDRAFAAQQYTQGAKIVVPSVRHIPREIIDPRIKYRSRLHWYLADREAHAVDSQAEALLLDGDGFVTETSRGNLLARFGDRVMTPSAETTLSGVSLAVVMELCSSLGYRAERANMTPDQLLTADEVWISNTTTCLVPVTHLNGKPIANGQPGPAFRQVMEAWSRLVGVDIIAAAGCG